jgi:glycosyltransferase involved in cell wall biosynthesis
MRVIHVAPTVFGASGLFGGGERYPLELARALARDVDCELVTFGRIPRLERDDGGLLIRVLRPAFTVRGHPAHPLARGMLAATAGADVIHTHHMRSTPSRVAALAAQVRGQRVVVTDHGLEGSDWLGLLPRLFDRFLAVSRYSAIELGAPPDRTDVIYGGADPGRYYPEPPLQRDGVLFVGRITPHKGVDRLIEALPDGAMLRIAGTAGHDPQLPERDYPQHLRRLAAGKQVEFLGRIEDAALPLLYRQARVLVLPSVQRSCYGRQIRVSELLGLVVLEAMASGTPVVASRIGGLPEIVEDGVTGYLVQPGNVAELRDRLSQLLRDPALAQRMGCSARERVLERFTWRACATRCLEAYQHLSRTRTDSLAPQSRDTPV